MAEKENDIKNKENGLNEENGVDEEDVVNEEDSPNEDNESDDDNIEDEKDGIYQEYYDDSLFEPIDVSEPRAPIKELEVIEEALAIRRRDWIKTHLSYIFAAVGLVVVILIALLINLFYQNSNPMRRFTASLSKDFDSPFRFDLQVTEDDQPMMAFEGAVAVNRSKHTIRAVYDADYNRYQYSGAVYADKHSAKKGSYYEKKWLVRDCMDNAQDFFDFDRDFRSGSFDGGAFLRFTGLTSDYSTRELNAFMDTLMKRLSTDSAIAAITSEKANDETHYHYDVSMQALFEMIKSDGASLFYRASDYDKFCSVYEINKGVISEAKCNVDYTIDGAGHMTLLEAIIVVGDKSYGMTCRMSDFGEAEVEIPQEFFKAADITPVE